MSGGQGESPESVRGLLRHSWIYSLAPIAQRLLSIVLVRLYTKRLPIGEYGIVEILDVLILIVPQLVGINLLGGLTRFYFEHDDPRRRAQVVSSTTLVLAVSSFLVAGLALTMRGPLGELLFSMRDGELDPGRDHALLLAILIVPFSICTASGLRYLQILKLSRTTTAIQVGKTVFEAALKLWMLFGLDMGVSGFLLGILISEVVCAAAFAVWMALRLRTSFDWGVFKPLLHFSLPLLPLGLVQLGLHQFGKLVIEHLGPQQRFEGSSGALDTTVATAWVGVFGLGYRIAFLFHSAVLTPFMQIWQPHVFGLPREQRRGELVRLGDWALVALCALYLPAAVFGRQAVDLLSGGPEYRAAWRVTPLVVAAYLCYGSYAMSQVALMAEKRTWSLLVVNVAALALGIALGVTLVPRWEEHGYTAAALATLGCFAPLAFGAEWIAARCGWRSRSAGTSVKLLSLVGLALVGAWFVDADRDPLAPGALPLVLGVKLGWMALVYVLLWRFGLDRAGREGLARLVRDTLAKFRKR
jgi:O-antigen/teichoic acid export membrane protein